MNVKKTAGLAAILVVLVLAGSAEGAPAPLTGGGKTHKFATLGIVAKPDGSGELTYRRADGTLWVHCTGFSSYVQSKTKEGLPRVELTARKCFRKDGSRRFLRAVFIDRGEPGNGHDGVRLWWSLRWPIRVRAIPARRRDRGRIQAGNIQIHV